MKKLILLGAVFFASISANAQVPPIMDNEDDGHFGIPYGAMNQNDGISVMDAYSQYPNVWFNNSNRTCTISDCESEGMDIALDMLWHNPGYNANTCASVFFAVKVFKVPFDHLNSILDNGEFEYSGNNKYPDNFDHGQKELVFHFSYDTGDESIPSNYSYWDNNQQDLVITAEANHAYFMEVVWKKSGCPSSWKTEVSPSFNVVTTSEAGLEPSNQVSSTTKSSYYGSATVYQFNQLNDVIFDGITSQCDDRHVFTIQEFDLNTWTGIGAQYNSGWIMSPAGQLNLSDNFTFQQGKVYHVSLAVGPQWSTQNLFFELLPAEIDVEFPSVKSTFQKFVPGKNGLTAIYTVHNLCKNLAHIQVDGSGSQFENKYRYEIVQVSSSNLAPIGNIGHYPGGGNFATGEAGMIHWDDAYNSTPGNTFSTNNWYKVTLFVGDNVIQESLYCRFIWCFKGAEDGNGEIQIVDMDVQELNVYPVPATDFVNIEMPYSEEGNQVNVYSSTGQLVYSELVEGQNSRLDVSDMTPGVYIIRVNSNDQIITSRIYQEITEKLTEIFPFNPNRGVSQDAPFLFRLHFQERSFDKVI